jgi:hypothetical protein
MRGVLLLALLPLIAAGAQDLVLSYTVPLRDVSTQDGPYGQSFIIPGASPLAHPGEPAIPAMPLYAVLPPGTRAVSVTLDGFEETSLPGTYDIRPMQHAVPISRPQDFEYTPPDPSAYDGGMELPVIMLSGQGSLMGFPVANLVFRPVEWDPASGRASLRTSVTFTVHCEPAESNAPGARSEASEMLARDIVRSTVINPQDVGFSGAVMLQADDLPWGEYLIITPQSLAAAFEPLAEFKTTIGIPSAIVTTEYIDANYTGVDQAQRIRHFLREIYATGAPSYVLLGGDVAQVDARNCWATAEGYVDNPAADIYYQDMNDTSPGADSWDHNGNGVWGEIGIDLMDYHPDYVIGRAACQTTAEVGIFVDKVMAYQIPSVDSNDTDPWYTSMGFTTAILWSSPFCPGSAGKEKVDTLYTPPAWQPVIKHYEEAGTQSYGATMEMLNRGFHLVNHAGHGSTNMVSIGPGYLQNSDFMGLTNISAHGRVSIWDTLACLSGAFDLEECLAEAWINSPGGGGFCMMNTRYGWGEPSDPGNQWSDLVDQQFFAEFFTGDMYHLGVAHMLAWDEYIGLIPSDTHYDWIAKSITLFGDPELPMWSAVPDGALDLDAPSSVAQGTSQVPVAVSDASGPVAGARICVMQGEWDDPAQYVVETTDASGQVLLDLNTAATPNTVLISAWARDHAPVTVEVPVSGTGIGGGVQPGITGLTLPFPNPAAASVHFAWGVAWGQASIEVFDLSGRVVRVLDRQIEGSGTLAWDLTDDSGRAVPDGIYMIRLSGASGSDARRLVVMHQ